MNSTRKEFAVLFSHIPVVLVGFFLALFPLIFSVQMTEAFLLPKHVLLAVIITLAMISFVLNIVLEGKARIKSTPFDIPILIFTFVVILSAVFSVNKFDSLIAAVPFMYAALLFYMIVNSVKNENALLFLLSSVILGAAAASTLTILSFLRIYVLPFAYTKSPYFSTIGSLLDQSLYLAMVLPVAGYFALRLLSNIKKQKQIPFAEQPTENTSRADLVFTIAFFIIMAGLLVTIFHLVTSQKPLILPIGNGFQIAFATISQDTGRMLKAFLFGSGYGTFFTDFMRFKQAAYNANSALWSVTFLRSSSFILELLATTGILGVVSFLYIIYKVVREKNMFLPLVIAVVAAFILPFSPMIVTFFFAILGIFALVRHFSGAAKYQELEVYLTAQDVAAEPAHQGIKNVLKGKQVAILPGLVILLIAGAIGVTDYYTFVFTKSDLIFQRSLNAASKNDGSQTYKLQSQAIQTFPYREVYHRVFSQTNLALANALAQTKPAGSSPSADLQQNILTLIQQSINLGRSSASLAPYSAPSWNNLSTIYRSLIGFGENADQFAVLTNQQAIALDPSNPQQYVNLGGIYYQLGMYDDAIRQFQTAIQLKPDYANAYYNAGHALEAKGNNEQALKVYEVVKSLVGNDQTNLKSISAEIDTLKAKVSDQSKQVAGAATDQQPEQTQPAEQTESLQVNKPVTQLPSIKPEAKIEGPVVTITPAPTTSKVPTPSILP